MYHIDVAINRPETGTAARRVSTSSLERIFRELLDRVTPSPMICYSILQLQRSWVILVSLPASQLHLVNAIHALPLQALQTVLGDEICEIHHTEHIREMP